MCNVSHAVFYWENEMEMYFDSREREKKRAMTLHKMHGARTARASKWNEQHWIFNVMWQFGFCMYGFVECVVAVIGRKIGRKKLFFFGIYFHICFFLVPLFVRLVCYYYWFWFAVSRLWMNRAESNENVISIFSAWQKPLASLSHRTIIIIITTTKKKNRD